MAAKKSSSSKSSAKKSTTKAAKKSTKAVKKTTAKRVTKTTKKVSTRRKTTTARKKATPKATVRTRKTPVRSSSASKPVTVTKTRRSSWLVIITSVILLVIAIGGMLYSNPQIWEELQANLLAQTGQSTQQETAGWLITRGPGDENAQKLNEIFATVFPDLVIEEVHYQSEQGKNVMAAHQLHEVPTILFSKAGFESQTLAPVVEELFSLHQDHYLLNTSLVNPSNQLVVGMNPSTDQAVSIGSAQAPITMVVYSEPKCQHCRVMEQNNMKAFMEWADKGVVKLVMMDLPQSRVGMLPSEAIHCMSEVSPDNYAEFRDKLFSKPNLTDVYTKREFQRLAGVELDSCTNRKKLFGDRQRQADKDGITGIPAIMVGKTGESQWLRYTGSSEDSNFYAELIRQLDPTAMPVESPPEDGSSGSEDTTQ